MGDSFVLTSRYMTDSAEISRAVMSFVCPALASRYRMENVAIAERRAVENHIIGAKLPR